MSNRGLLDVKTLTGTTDGDSFYEFVNVNLLPHLQPFNGRNIHSVVIMDNCSVHHISEVTKAIRDVGSLLIFLPPYSPDFNPIEELFSKVKLNLKASLQTPDELTLVGSEMDQVDLQSIILMAFSSITVDDCVGWISCTGIYSQNDY